MTTNKNAIIVNGLTVSMLDDFSTVPTESDATAIIKTSMEKAGNDVIKAMKCFAELYGWTAEDCRSRFVVFCMTRARCKMIQNLEDESDVIARYVKRFAGEEIERVREYVKVNGNDIKSALVQSI